MPMGAKGCKGCGAVVEGQAAEQSYEIYEAVYCAKCITEMENGIERKAAEDTERVDNQSFNAGDEPDTCEVIPYGAPSTPGAPSTAQPTLDIDTIKKYICPNATDTEAYSFMQLCLARNLNPFTKEAYLLKYGQGPATIVVGKDAFTRRAEDNPQFDGFEAGIIVEIKDDEGHYTIVDDREGTFYHDDEKLVGGWAKVYRKDHKYPIVAKVSMKEYVQISKKTDKPNAQWTKMPATMIRKVGLVQALRESFPSDLGGCYDSSEMGAEI